MKWFVAQEFVEKAIFDRWADAQFHVRVKLHDSGGQKMRSGMAKDVEGVWIFFCEDLQGDILVERAAKIEKQAAIFGGIDGIGKNAGLFLGSVAVAGAYLGDQGGVGQAGRNGLGYLKGSGPLWEVLYAAIGKSYVNLIHGLES